VKFCEECSANLELQCPNRKAKIPPGRKFCGECGFKLTEPAETPPIDYAQPQSYTPKFLADKILTSRSSLEGERKLVTVLFADVANYTAMAEKLDPEEVHRIMDGYFKVLMNDIHHHEGNSWILLGRILGKIEPHQINMAAEPILKGVEILQRLKLKAMYSQGYLFLGELYLNGGKIDKAKNSLKRAEGMFQEMGMGYWLARTREVMAKF